jgi:hypothetical protein
MADRPYGLTRQAAALSLASASLVAAAAVGSIFLTSAREAWAAIGATGPAGPADGILLVAGLGGTLLSLWLGLGMALSALAILPGALGDLCRPLAERVAPAAVRRVVAFILGTTLAAAFVPGTAVAGVGREAGHAAVLVATAARHPGAKLGGGVAVAAPDASFRSVSERSSSRDRAVVGRGLDEVDAAPPPSWPANSNSHAAARAKPSLQRITVRPGDTLWSIAADHLGRAASNADISAEWPRWFAANREAMGTDADLILPGQMLRPPASRQAAS